MDNKNTQKVSYRIEISKELWEKFKASVTSEKTINQHLIDLIEEKIKG